MPEPTPNLEQAIRDNAAGPAKAAGDSGSVEQHPLKDQIEADRYLASKDAAINPAPHRCVASSATAPAPNYELDNNFYAKSMCVWGGGHGGRPHARQRHHRHRSSPADAHSRHRCERPPAPSAEALRP